MVLLVFGQGNVPQSPARRATSEYVGWRSPGATRYPITTFPGRAEAAPPVPLSSLAVGRPLTRAASDAQAARDTQSVRLGAFETSQQNALQAAQARVGQYGPGYIGVDVNSPGYQLPQLAGGASSFNYILDAAVSGPPPGAVNPNYVADTAIPANMHQAPEYVEGQEWEIGYSMSPEELASFRERAMRLGLYNDSAVLGSVFGPGDADVMRQLMYYANVTTADSWETALADIGTEGGNAGNVFGPGGAGGTGTGDDGPVTTTSVTYQRTGVDTGRAALRDLMRSMLGREATNAEVRRYVGALNRAEDNNPQIVESVSDAANNRTETRVLEPGVDEGEFLYGKVEAGNAREVKTYRANDFMSIVERLA